MPQNTLQLITSNDEYLHAHIPWWRDVSADVRAQLRLEPLAVDGRCMVDVVVIGGGVAGLSAALGARAAGAEVLVLEATAGLGRGATGRNAGILSAGVNMGMANLDPRGDAARFWPETTRVLLDLVAESRRAGSLLQANLTGSLSLAESAHAARELAREVKARVALGVKAELWSAEQVAERTGGRLNTRHIQRAMWLPDEGRIHPLTLLAHLARKARAVGVKIAGNAEVAWFAEQTPASGPATWSLMLTSGQIIQARGLINAVGPTAQPTARIYALAFEANLPDDFPLFWDASPYTYADYRAGYGRLTVSGGRYGKVGGNRHEAGYYQRLSAGARHWLPELTTQQPVYQWSVDLNVTADMVPNLRPLGEQAPGLAVEGLGALGVLPGIVLGQRGGAHIASTLSEHGPLLRAG
ncbi:MAG TPA: FAD-dependent oxidoreductase [Ktedonobacteraceae bacterium]|nr:FAD-dependent oxidoreductase [Ktedonobacteraceae bacterium]